MASESDAAFFAQPANPLQRRYEVLRAFFLEGLTAEAVARRFGYAVGSVYAMTRDFRRLDDPAAFFFRPPEAPGRAPVLPLPDVRQRVIELRKANLSVPDIKARLDAEQAAAPSLRAIGNVLCEEGFQRLPRRTRAERAAACALPRASCSTRARRRLSSPSAPPACSACCPGSAATACCISLCFVKNGLDFSD